MFGGRARVESGVEHCQRLFIEDYNVLFDILKSVEIKPGKRLFDNLDKIDRYVYLKERGWVEITHMYALLSSELTIREKLSELKGAFSPPLLGNHHQRSNENVFPKLRDFSLKSLIRAFSNALRSKKVYSLSGPTDAFLINPWIEFLEEHGVKFILGSKVERLSISAESHVYSDGDDEYDANIIVFTSYLSDTMEILARSNLNVSCALTTQMHCCCYTIQLDPREPILKQPRNSLYTRHGYFYFIQPRSNRCVIFCGRAPDSTEKEVVIEDVKEGLDLKYEVQPLGVAENKSLRDAIHVTDYIDSRIYPIGYEQGIFLQAPIFQIPIQWIRAKVRRELL